MSDRAREHSVSSRSPERPAALRDCSALAPPVKLAGFAILALAMVGGAGGGVAMGHSGLAESSPAAGATVDRLPETLRLTFDDPVLRVALVEVRAGGTVVTAGAVRRDPADARSVTVALRGGAASGIHRVSWSVVGVDGHLVVGRFAFRVPGEPAPTRQLGPLGGAASEMDRSGS